eukprot:CAMPEP_0206236786 /NCGR_PEP_ID=MMETSP0047_2-20121206/13905_1 /ASSEMBLY_ACC=CAM_ASM_000192 /TAXON_ID=195065 /ORGANISM="Chroomonas mesostigmatica_cf, Strain CCMP1168" /LENGTH=36 /DNA_ID= /DNA_START= /DNA_END= /DNA_ORIENTATION=
MTPPAAACACAAAPVVESSGTPAVEPAVAALGAAVA